jgi:hypothetical protein
MAEGQRPDSAREAEPTSFPEVPPPPYLLATSQTWYAEAMMQLQNTIGELRANVVSLQSGINKHEQSFRNDFRWTWTGLAAATVLLMGALIFGYFRLEDRQSNLDKATVRIETKVDDALQRLPAAPANVLQGCHR